MNLDSLSLALSQISYSVANLTKKNYKSTVAEISYLISQHKVEASRHLFRCLFSHVDFTGDGKSSGKDFHQIQFLTQELSSLISKPNFVSTLCYAVDNPLNHQKTLKSTTHLLPQLSRVLKLTRVQEVAVGLALLNSSSPETVAHAAQFVRQKLPHLLNSYIDADSGGSQEVGLQDTPIEVLHLLLTHLFQGKERFGISREQKEAFLKLLRKDFPPDRVPAILSPLLYPAAGDIGLDKLNPSAVNMPKAMMEGSLAEMIMEVGYVCTSSVEECRNTLVMFGVREINAASVARVLGMMSKTTTGLQDPVQVQTLGGHSNNTWGENKDKPESGGPNTWNVDVFVQVVKDLASHLNWRDVITELDHPGFVITSKAGLRLVVQALLRALQEMFPVDLILRPWTNTEGQISWISHSLKNPDVFCFADYNYHPVVIDILKTPPDSENRDIKTWKSLELVETLLRLSAAGHYQQCMELFKFPLQHCPDMLVLALLQISIWNTLKHDLLSSLIPIFLGNHSNSGIVLHYAWHCQEQSSTIRTLIMHAMAEWYMRGEHSDQGRLSRILDVAQDLKALSMLLNATPFAFVIDLACLASRREYLKLDKWLSDKIREHGEPFIQASVHFLKRRCPQLVGIKEEQQLPAKSQQLPPEAITTMLACLQACLSSVTSQELSETIRTMLAAAPVVLSKVRQQPPTPGVGVVGNKGPPLPPPGAALPGLQNTVTNPMDTLSSIGALGLTNPGLVASTPMTNPFPASFGTLTTPASPAKSLPSLGPVSQTAQGFNPLQSITSQLQGFKPPSLDYPPKDFTAQSLNMTTTMSTGLPNAGMPSTGMPAAAMPTAMPTITRGTPTLGALSSQVALKQQQSVDQLRQPRVTQSFPKEIEDEANSYFQRIFNHPPHPTISIDEVLDMLKRFKDSSVKKEKDVFSCMLRNLFEEYKFFAQYPEKELTIIAVLFGGIIEQGLVTYMDLGIALRYVLEALKKQHGSKMYSFGIAALDRFKTRLKDYPQYCQFLAGIPHFSQFPRHLKEYIEYGARSQEPPNKPQGPVTPVISRSLTPVSVASTSTPTSNTGVSLMPVPSQPQAMPAAAPQLPAAAAGPVGTPTPVSTGALGAIARPTNAPRPSIANATNIDTLLAGTEGKEEIAVPPESVQDKVFFIFNNLSLSNMEQKAAELNEHVTDEYLPWVSQYLVMKRASIEHNFHTLYANFIDAIKRPELMQMVVRETFRNIKVLLRSDKGVANFSDRSLLKNLGHWLGMLLLARNKPILLIEIDLKSLLYEAYHKGAQELLYVVPFVAKVLESTAKSKVFKPPNPWTMAIMNVLAELHTEPELKLNLKFEIEVLCKTLNIDFNELTPTNYLKDPARYSTIEHQLSAPSKVKESSTTPQPEEPLQINMPTPTTTNLGSTVTTSSTVTTATPVIQTPQPRFNYQDINVMSLAGLAAHIIINEQLPIFIANPQLKQIVRPAIEHSVQELLPPVVERSMKIALTTCEQIVKKDFALDPEETRMRTAAHHMVKFMTAGMALITCREPLLVSISNNIKQALLTSVLSPTQKDLIEQSAQVIASDNVELACAFIQKTAVEKAIPEMDKRLATEYELRKHARNEGRRYCDPIVLTYQAERMPEQIRLKVGGVTPQQIAVYEEFARGTPGFVSASEELGPGARPMLKPQMPYMPDDIGLIYDKICREIDQHLHLIIAPQSNPQVAALTSLREAVLMAPHMRDMVTASALVQKAVEGLLEDRALVSDPELTLRYRECHLLVLKYLQDPRAHGQQWVNKQVTRCLVEAQGDHKFNVEAVDCLIRSQLVNMQQYDVHLSQSMENGLNYPAVVFAMQLVQRFLLDDKHAIQLSEGDFINTIDMLARIAAHSRQAPEGLTALIEAIHQQSDSGSLDKAPMGPTSMMQSGVSQAREFDDPPGLHEKTEFLLREWVTLYHSPAAGRDSSKAFCAIVSQMHQQGILKTDDLITRFFRLCTEMCVDLCYRALADQSHTATLIRSKCFHTLDAFVRLIALLVKHSGDSTNTGTKINLLNKVLGIVAGVLLQDHEVRYTEFHQLPFHRIFIMLFIELNAPEHILESINYQVLTAFCHTFHILRPAKAPGFAYAWLELVSHRVFIGRMLAITPQQRGWKMYANLLIDLFRFLAPFLRNAELTKPTQLLYKGTLRVLLVLLHDFPEFLCDYYYTFCDVIPPNCIQMRNLILSTFPRNMRLPDPFTPNLKVDLLPEISHTPRIVTNITPQIQTAFKKDLDSYLKSRARVTFLSELRSKLQISTEPGARYNIPLINALVLYVGTEAINYIHQKGLTPSMSTIAHSSHMDIFQNLAVDLDTEGRYLFLNAIANQLRYPNSHTHYFSCTLLYLFAEANSEAIQEQITRVLLERLIVNRPHPWGLLVTFIELIKNPQFKFWNHEFVRCAPEIEKLFESVARSCSQHKQPGGVREAESWTEKS